MSISFTNVNGIYNFTVANVIYNGVSFVSSVQSGSATAGSAKAVSFTEQTSFSESGLPSNVLWSVTYANQTKSALVPANIVFSTGYGSYKAAGTRLTIGSFNYTPSPNAIILISGTSDRMSFASSFIQQNTTTSSSSSSTSTIMLPVNATTDTIISFFATSSVSNFTSNQLSAVNSLNATQLNGALAAVQGLNTSYNTTPIYVNYGNYTQKAKPVKVGQQRYYLTKKGAKNVLIHEVVVKKAVPKLNIIVAGVKLNQPNQTYVIHYPIINGKSSYTINPTIFSSLLGNNTAKFTYSVQIANRVVSSNAINTSSISKAFSYNIPANQAFSMTFETTGNANYTAVDPNVIVMPTNIVFYIPIKFTNPSASATASPFEANVLIDSLANSVHETTSVNNIEFFDSTGNIISSWLEGNILNENQNTLLNHVIHNQYWVQLPAGIPGSGSVTIYMGFAGNVPSAANDLMDCVNTGEAPQLSFVGVYGDCDNGANIFTTYWNFAGTALPTGWATGTGTDAGNILIANGLKFMGNYAVVNSIPESIDQITEAKVWVKVSTASNVEGMAIGSNRLGNPINAPWLTIGSGQGNLYNGIYHSFSTGKNSVSVDQGITANKLIKMFNGNIIIGMTAQPNNVVFYNNGIVEGTITAVANIPLTTQTYQIEFGDNTPRGAPFYVNWTRQRPYPPGGVVPTISFGTSGNGLVTTFTESGLPGGTTWNVIFGNSLLFTTAPTDIAFTTNSGTVLYSVATVTNSALYTPSPASGSLAAGGTQAITFTQPAVCTVILSNTAIDFGSVPITGNAPTSNDVADTNGGSVPANILLDGTNWVSGGNNFFAGNIVWDFSPHSGGVSGNALGLAPGNLVDTLNVIAVSQLIDLFFGTQVPAQQASGTYTQTITIENLC